MHPERRALLLGLAAVLLWSTVATAFKLALRQLDVWQLLLYACISSSVFLLALLLWRGQLQQLWRYFTATPAFFLAMAALNPLLYYAVLLRAYDLLPAQQAQAINYTWAITMALLAVPLLHQRLGWRDLVACALGYTGVLLIATRGAPLSLQFDSGEGVILALLSTVIWALYWIFNTRNQRDVVVSLCLNFLLATPLALLLCVIFSDPLPAPGLGLLAAVYVGLFEMGLTFVLWSSALRLGSKVSRIANLIFLSPVLSLVFIANILGESIHPATYWGLALIIPGALIQQGAAARSRGEPADG